MPRTPAARRRAARTRIAVAGGAALAVGLSISTATGAAIASPVPHRLHVVQTLAKDLVGPLQFAVSGRHVYVADAFTSTLRELHPNRVLAHGPAPSSDPNKPGGDVAGVAVDPATHAIAYTTSTGDHKDNRLIILSHGHRLIVNLSAFEAKHNPDGYVRYGIGNPAAASAKCKAELTKGQVPISYHGEVDSHPYAVTAMGRGAWAVAEAGGNDVLRVSASGSVSVLAVLPAQVVEVTEAFAAASHAPDCVGISYRFEAVPTDVETSHSGLLVTTLPGGPEGPNNGNPGSVYRLGARGSVHRIATGFAGATNLAVGPHCRIFVAELSNGVISEVIHGRPVKVASLPGVVAVEWANGHLYASTAPAAAGAKGPGTVVRLG